MTFLAITLFSTMPLFSAGALDTLNGVQAPSLTPSVSVIPTPVVKETPIGQPAPHLVTASGVIKKQGMTTYMYGTHTLVNDKGRTLYALKSNNIKLDDYVDKKVTVKGELIEGYPVEKGPNYLNVDSIQAVDR